MAGSAWTNQIQNTVIVAGPTGTITGFFVYNGTPGPGNPPVGSWTTPGTTKDPFGNTILPDLVVGQTGNGQVQLIPGNPSSIKFPVTGTWQSFPRITAISSSSAGLQIIGGADTTGLDLTFFELNSGIAGSGAQWFAVYQDGNGGVNTQIEGTFAGLQLPVVASMSAVAPGTGTSTTNPAGVEGWHNMSLLNSWTAPGGFVTNRYRLVASPQNSVEIIGSLSGTAATAGTFATLPSAYHPASQQRFAAEGAASSAGAPGVQCDTSGNLTMAGIPGLPVADSWFYHGFISLDA